MSRCLHSCSWKLCSDHTSETAVLGTWRGQRQRQADPQPALFGAESGAPRFDEASVPLDKRKPVPVETLGQVDHELVSLWINGAAQCHAKCQLTGIFERLPDQLCQPLDWPRSLGITLVPQLADHPGAFFSVGTSQRQASGQKLHTARPGR